MNARPLEWAREYAATMDDVPSLRSMHRFARENAAEAKRLMKLLRLQPEDAAVFKPDFNTNIEAMQLIEARMAELGVEL